MYPFGARGPGREVRRPREDHPTDLLAVRIRDNTRFRHGQTATILAQADALAPHWSPELPGFDCFQTVWAFAHEEAGAALLFEEDADDVAAVPVPGLGE